MKYIAVTGGVVSGLGKGITISSIGRLMKQAGLKVTAIKIDPYLNTDAGELLIRCYYGTLLLPMPFDSVGNVIIDDQERRMDEVVTILKGSNADAVLQELCHLSSMEKSLS